ncbi:Transcription factor E2F2, partial [Eumeta japonica]
RRTSSQEDSAYLSLKDRSNQLAALEEEIDMQLDDAKRNLKYIKEDETNRSFAYVTRDDLLAVFENPPLMPLNPPHNDYNFVLSPDEGICELYEVPSSPGKSQVKSMTQEKMKR